MTVKRYRKDNICEELQGKNDSHTYCNVVFKTTKREVLKVKIKHWNATQLTQNVSFIVLELINPGMKKKDLDHYHVNLSGELKLFASLAEKV